jgi:hypothetical protein
MKRRAPNTSPPNPDHRFLPFSMSYMWGNTAAINILELNRNEGSDAKDRDLNIMCAASGDLRNVVKTVSSMPKDYTSKLSFVMNDIDFDISARNAVLLMMALYLDIKQAIPSMDHLWYSARLPKSMLKLVQDTLLPLIEDVCTKVAGKADNIPLGKTSTNTSVQSVCIVLTKSQWYRLKGYFSISQDVAAKTAEAIREKAVNNPARRDAIQEGSYTRWPALRVYTDEFRNDGILLRYGASRVDFDAWNPTYLQRLGQWAMTGDCEPHMGWSHEDIMKGANKAKADYLGAQ